MATKSIYFHNLSAFLVDFANGRSVMTKIKLMCRSAK